MLEYGLPPVIDGRSRILILGSFPSVKSRGYFYYGHPQNRFWKTLGEVLGSAAPPTPEEKMAWLLAHRVALWDIVARCEIEGSSDSDLRVTREEVNDIPALLRGKSIRRIFCNGKKSLELVQKFFPALAVTLLPSTSPANPRFDPEVWRRELGAALSGADEISLSE